MRLVRIIRELDFLLAFTLFFCAGVGSWYAYAAMMADQKRGSLLENSLRLGVHRFVLKSRGQCVGEVESGLETNEEGLSWNLSGDILVDLSGQTVPITLNVQAGFNLLGQLGGAVIELEAKGNELRLGLLDIDPIKVTVRMTNQGVRKEHNFVIPGPFLLKKSGRQEYRIYYRALSGLDNSYFRIFAEGMRGGIDLAVQQSTASGSDCRDSPRAALNLDPVVRALHERFSGLAGLAPGFMLQMLD